MALQEYSADNGLNNEFATANFEQIVVKQEKVDEFVNETANVDDQHHEPIQIKEEIPRSHEEESDKSNEIYDEELAASIKYEGTHFLSEGSSFYEGYDSGVQSLLLDNSGSGTDNITLENIKKEIHLNPWQCKICSKVFSSPKKLDFHAKTPSRDKTFACCACAKSFRDMTQLNIHIRKHTGEKPFECEICSKKFSIKGNLNKHTRVHTGDKPFACEICERKFTQFAHLEDHLNTHSVERPFICDHCDGRFKTKHRLRKHIKTHLREAKKKNISCPSCLRTFFKAKHLMIHMIQHNDQEFPFICIICKKQFKEYTVYQNHVRHHKEVPGIRPYKCHLCVKTFVCASHLTRHIKSHSGLRPYTCDICMRGFPYAQNLKRHLQTHTGEKPFVCETCTKAFSTIANLQRHNRIHTGEKPFECTICSKKFAHSTTAKDHMRIHTGEKPFGCSICNQRFALNKFLYKHIRAKHPEHAGIVLKTGSQYPIPFIDVDQKVEQNDDEEEEDDDAMDAE